MFPPPTPSLLCHLSSLCFPLAWSNLRCSKLQRGGRGSGDSPPPCWATGWMEDGKVERGFILLLWLRFKTHVNVSLLFTSLGYSVLSCLSTFQKKPSFITPNSKEILPPFPPVTSYISVHAPNWSFYNSKKIGDCRAELRFNWLHAIGLFYRLFFN